MIRPASYFSLITHSESLLDAINRFCSPRLTGLYGDHQEIIKLLAAARCRSPYLTIVREDEFRRSTYVELHHKYQRSMVLVQSTEPARYVNRFEINRTPYRPLQILSDMTRDVQSVQHMLEPMLELVAAEIAGPLDLRQQLKLTQLRASYTHAMQPSYRWLCDQLQTQIEEETNMTIDTRNIDWSKVTPEFYREHRHELVHKTRERKVAAETKRLQEMDRQDRIKADPEAHVLAGLKQRRSEVARQGRKTFSYDEQIEKIETRRAAEAKRQAFLSSDMCVTTLEVAMQDRELVAKFDPGNLTAIDVALERYKTDHQSRDQLYDELAKLSRTATLNECKSRRDAEFESAKAAHELAAADLARAEAQQETNQQLQAVSTINGGDQ